MSNYFCLRKLGSPEPQRLQEIDDDMRRHFGAPLDPERWYRNWYETIGLSIAMGIELPKMREIWNDRIEVIDWLVGTYEWSAWAGR